MTYVFNSERLFKDEMIDGLAAAYSRYLRRIPMTSAVASVSAPQRGRVSTIVGGGSGHYPSFAGLVGPGLADAAACGDVFTSPSAEQVYRTIRAVDGGAGVLMLFGNYQGDVMHFGLAADQARDRDGIDARIVVVTDDIASAPDASHRRGIAGNFFIFRAAAAAAHRGDSLDDVERIARAANEVTRTIGVAFDGCTVPGRDAPLFTVDPGTMELGLGIHGESGIETMPLASADDLGSLLVGRLLAERPAGATRARILINGLGRVKCEEMLILFRAVAANLDAAGVGLTEPEVGEFVTSMDMAGVSVTLVWTDDELETLLSAPAAAPGYTRPGAVTGLDADPAELGITVDELRARSGSAGTSAELEPSGRAAQAVLTAIGARMHELESRLGDLDAVAADGDHGTTMTRGIDAAVAAAGRAGPDAAAVLTAAGMAFADAAGGASGALWGSGLTTVASSIGSAPACPDAATMGRAFADVLDAVMRLGGSEPGDKTLVDVLAPFTTAYADAVAQGADTAAAWARACDVADDAARATAALRAARGRASWLAERSVGTQDPGAVSLAAALRAASDVIGHADGGAA